MRTINYHLIQPISLNLSKCLCTGARVFAAIIPLAATAGNPIPGNVESPQQYNPGRDVPTPGKKPTPAQIVPPSTLPQIPA